MRWLALAICLAVLGVTALSGAGNADVFSSGSGEGPCSFSAGNGSGLVSGVPGCVAVPSPTPTPSATPTPSPTPTTSPQNIVQTWCLDNNADGGSREEGANATAAQVNAFCSYAESSQPNYNTYGTGKAFTDYTSLGSGQNFTPMNYLQINELTCGGSGLTPSAGPTCAPASNSEIQGVLAPYLDSLSTSAPDANFVHATSTQTAANRVYNSGCDTAPCMYPNPSTTGFTNFVTNCIVQGGSGANCGNKAFNGLPEPGGVMSDLQSPFCQKHFFQATPPPTPYPYEYSSPSPGCDSLLNTAINTYMDSITYADTTHPVRFFNSIAPPGNGNVFVANTSLTSWTSHAEGAVDEDFICTSSSIAYGQSVTTDLDDIAIVFNESSKGYYALLERNNASNAANGSATQLQFRRFCGGVFYLAFNPTRSVIWSNYYAITSTAGCSTGNNCPLNAFPEYQLFPIGPLQTMADVLSFGAYGSGCNGTSTDGTQSGGVGGVPGSYSTTRLVAVCLGNTTNVLVREFANNYYWKNAVGNGKFIVIVNNSNSAQTVSSGWYSNGPYNAVMILSGNDVQTDACSTSTGCPFAVGATNPSNDDVWFSTTLTSGAVNTLYGCPSSGTIVGCVIPAKDALWAAHS